MLAKILSYALDGLTGYAVDVEVDINSGLPGYDMVGLASTATKESKERVRSAVKNSGFQYPAKRIIVNLAPADTKKEGPVFDLAVALGIMAATGQLENKAYKQYVIIGELSLNGELRHVNGIMPLLISAMQAGHRKFIIPASTREKQVLSRVLKFMRSKLCATSWKCFPAFTTTKCRRRRTNRHA